MFCLAATAADATVGGSHLIEAIMISSIFFYIVLYSHDNRRDTLTGLLNRRAFYDDCINYQSSVTAVASLDMNGLKELNDDHGHLAGDQALISIGKCISDAVGRNIQAYRVGGDEFILLAFSGNAEKIAYAIKCIKESVTACGYHISAGYTVQEKDQELTDTIKESDRLMYEDKARYYQESGKNRRRR